MGEAKRHSWRPVKTLHYKDGGRCVVWWQCHDCGLMKRRNPFNRVVYSRGSEHIGSAAGLCVPQPYSRRQHSDVHHYDGVIAMGSPNG